MAFDWKATLATVAPGLATALGGPLAGMATKAILDALGMADGATASDLAAAVQGATPEQMLALKQADQQFAIQMRELDVDVERVSAGDRDSARKREAIVLGWSNPVLAALVVGGFMTTVFMVISGHVEGLKDPLTSGLIGTLIGYVSAKADQVIAYYFGSTATSRHKDATITALTK